MNVSKEITTITNKVKHVENIFYRASVTYMWIPNWLIYSLLKFLFNLTEIHVNVWLNCWILSTAIFWQIFSRIFDSITFQNTHCDCNIKSERNIWNTLETSHLKRHGKMLHFLKLPLVTNIWLPPVKPHSQLNLTIKSLIIVSVL